MIEFHWVDKEHRKIVAALNVEPVGSDVWHALRATEIALRWVMEGPNTGPPSLCILKEYAPDKLPWMKALDR